jgi:hypothetical protein
LLTQTKNDFTQGPGSLSKNDVTWGKVTALVCHPTKKVNKEEELTYLSSNFNQASSILAPKASSFA